MSNNYSPDPNRALPVNNMNTPQSGSGDAYVPPLSSPIASRSSSGSSSDSGQSSYAASNSALPESNEMSSRLRLSKGVALSEGRYVIENLVASGGMGAVYRATDKRFNRPCAVKEMLDEFRNDSERTQAIEWFSREATMLLDLNHPCIPRVRDFFLDNGKHYLVMDYIDGRTLSDVLEKEGNVVGLNGARGVIETRTRSWAQQICSVLGYLHNQIPPIIFRDLKPANIMITNRDEVKLIDFGIARTFQSQRQSTIIMTFGYAPPEQLHGMPEPRSDIYALGATLHRVLTNHDAANNKPAIFSFPPVRSLRPDISPSFEQIIMKALAYQPEQRWGSSAEMERALINLPPVTVVPPIAPARSPEGQHAQGALTPHIALSSSGSAPSTPRPSTGSGATGPAGSYVNAAMGHLVAGRIDAAYTSATQACGLEPENALVHKVFGQVFARRVPPQVDLAIKAYNRSLQINPDDAETHKLVGDIWLFLQQQPLQSITAYRQSLNLNTNDPETHFRLGQCYDKTGQLEPALREYQEALNLVPKQPVQPALHFALTLGQLAMRMNQLPIAEHAYVQALIMNRADHQTRFQLSQVYERENKLEDAFRECSYVIGPLGSNPAVQQMYQRLRTRLGR
jgi:serine/threonine protein kinase